MTWKYECGVAVGAALCAVTIAANVASSAVQTRPEGELPAQLRDIGVDQHLNEQIPPDLLFQDEDGKDVRLGEFFDGRRPVILTLVYFECPMLCTLVLNDLVRCVNLIPELGIGKDFQILSISFNPREGPALAEAKKKHYLQAYDQDRAKAAGGWHFLTGQEEAIHRLTSAAGFRYKYDPKYQQYVHPSAILVLTPHGTISRYFFGIGYEPKDLRLALVEASSDRIGTITDQLLLYCFHYDPSTGRYSLAVLDAVKAGGVLILIVVGALLVVLIRRDRRRKAAAEGVQQPTTQDEQPPKH